MLKLSSGRFLGLLLTAALGLRLLGLLLIEWQPVSDAAWYHTAAMGLAEGRGYQVGGEATAAFPIGYPAWLAGWYALLGAKVGWGQFANLLLSGLIIGLTYALGRQYGGEKTARLASLFIAFYPNYFAYTYLLLSELLFTSLLLLGLWFARKKGNRAWLLTGLAWGLAAHVKPWLVVIPLVLVLFHRKKWPWRSLLPVYGLMALLALPWGLRNLQAFGRFVPYATNGGINLYIGNNPLATGTYHFEGPVAARLDSSLNEAERDQQAAGLAWQYLWEEPREALSRLPDKLYYLFHMGNEGFYWLKMGKVNLSPGAWRAFSILGQVGYLLWLGLVGLRMSLGILPGFRTRWPLAREPLVMGLSMLAVYLLFFGYSRYHFPMVVLMLL
jgi:4-amino-4-deoxy-L-arabinose transferase-like glycosyltransferase